MTWWGVARLSTPHGAKDPQPARVRALITPDATYDEHRERVNLDILTH